ncbi:hypothetical protein Btru_046280 [Bulinus truncatus]|nr:hypothetical protein Btru_046280 [Bulinus truncatus]
MNVQNFIDTLKRIGYPNSDSLDPNSLEWALENEATLPFLKWFCDNINEENVLSTEEMEEYKTIENSGTVLKGADLEEALHLLVTNNEKSSSEQVEDDEEVLKESLLKAKAQKDILKSRCNKLSLHQMGLCNKVSKMEEVEEHFLKSCHQLKVKCGSQNSKMDEALENLSASLSSAEVRYSHELTSFTKKLFFEGVADLTGEKDSAQYGLLDTSFPEQAIIAAEEKESFSENCQEFSRLQRIFPKSECDRINAFINAKKAVSAVNEARSILHYIKSGQFPSLPSDISRLHHSTEQSIEAAKAEALPYLSSLPVLLRELGGLQGTEILTGDYNLKLKRQDYFIKNQDKVIKHLLVQRGRNEFLTMLYEIETRCHSETCSLLASAREMLEKHLQDWQQRMKDLEDPDLNSSKYKRSVVDSRDTSSVRLYHLLADPGDGEKILYLPKKKIIDAAEEFQDNYNCVRAMDRTADDKYLSKVGQLEDSIKNCESTLYAGSSTSSGIPNLSPVEVQSTMAALISKFSTLETEISKVIDDVTAKKTVLKNNVLQRKERELFTFFHNNPKGLQDLIHGLIKYTLTVAI